MKDDLIMMGMMFVVLTVGAVWFAVFLSLISWVVS